MGLAHISFRSLCSTFFKTFVEVNDTSKKCGSQPSSKLDDPGPCPPKLVFLDHFFGGNVLFHQFDPTNTPKCYTWLESYGSSLRDGKNEKIFFWTCVASDFRGRSQTDFLHDLEARL